MARELKKTILRQKNGTGKLLIKDMLMPYLI